MSSVARGALAALVLSTLSPASAGAETLPEIVVSPYLVATPIARAGSTVSVIRRVDIEQSSAGSVTQLLRTTPGILVEERGGPGGQTDVRLRGAETQHTLVLIDGIRVNDPSSARSNFDFALLSLTDIERIEILRGPQSALYGSDAMGGVINIITRRPSGAVLKSATVEGGSYGTRRVSGSVSGGQGNFSGIFSGTYFASDGFSRVGDRDNDEADGTEKFAGTLRTRFTGEDGKSLEFGLDGQHQVSEIDENSTTDAEGFTSQRGLLNGFARARFDTHDGKLSNAVTFFVTRSTREFAEPSRTTFYRGGTAGAEYQGELRLPRGSLVFGGRVEHEDAFRWRSDRTDPYYNDGRKLYAGYLLYQLPLDQLNLSFAVRHDGEVDGEAFTTGRVTAVYDMPNHNARLRGSVGTGAKRPTAFQLSYNPDLASEHSVGADVGIEKDLFDGRVQVSKTVFWNSFRDLINWQGSWDGTYENISQAETAGLELAARAMIVPGKLHGRASYTYLHSRDLATGLPLQRRAEHSGQFSLIYTGIDRLETTASVTFVGERFDDDEATERLAPYARVDLAADYRVNSNLTVFGRVENLFNVTYFDAGGYNAPGLSAYGGLKWQN